MKPAEYHRRAREIVEARSQPAPVLAVLSSFTTEVLKPYLVVAAHDAGLDVDPWFGPFGQLDQMVLPTDSPLWKASPRVVWLAVRPEDIDPDWLHATAAKPEERAARLEAIRRRVIDLAKEARKRSTCSLLVSNFAISTSERLSVFDASDPDGFAALLAQSNRELARQLADIPDAYVLDYAGLVARQGAGQWQDPKMWFMARVSATAENQLALCALLARTMAGVMRPRAKCVVLDLDNTLWGGVLGEDGVGGIQLGPDYPGNVYKRFQSYLMSLRDRGILLAVASKNDEPAVLEALESHTEMLIRREHIACLRANWNPKPGNLKEIAKALNIGLDSLVFVDDNPVERAAVRAELPMVHVVELPQDPMGFLPALQNTALLDQPKLLAEDRLRAESYQSDEKRRIAESKAPSVEEFLHSLKMVAETGPADSATIPRIHQLFQKTNQFNLTTRRPSLEDARRWMEAKDMVVRWLRVKDHYGDLGLICTGMARQEDERSWVVEDFLMSCRAMGRGVETAFLTDLIAQVRLRGAERLVGIYRQTPKNSCVADFYQKHGFSPLAAGTGSEQRFELDLRTLPFRWPLHIARTGNTET